MGYRPKRKIYTLEFEDPDLDGLIVKVRGLNTGQILDIDTAREDGGDEAIRGLLELLAAQIVEWNVEDDEGQPAPATLDGIRAQELAFNMAIIDAWQNAVTGVPAPLEQPSTDGEQSMEASIPMETLQLPQESTAVPA
jgi:hypothetical protein